MTCQRAEKTSRAASICSGSPVPDHNSVVGGERPGGRPGGSCRRHNARRVEAHNDRHIDASIMWSNAANVFSNNVSNSFVSKAPYNAVRNRACSLRRSLLSSSQRTCRRSARSSERHLCRCFLTNNERYAERHNRAFGARPRSWKDRKQSNRQAVASSSARQFPSCPRIARHAAEIVVSQAVRPGARAATTPLPRSRSEYRGSSRRPHALTVAFR